MPIPAHNDPSDDRLIRRHLDGELSDSEFNEFEQRLMTDASFRRRFVQLSDLESAMAELLASGQVQTVATPVDRTRNGMIQVIAMSVLATTVAGLILFVVLNKWSNRQGAQPIASSDVLEKSAAPQQMKIVLDAPSIPPVAVITATNDAFEGTLKVGQRMLPGTFSFRKGLVQLEFMSGAVVALEGPAEIRIESQSRATLVSGRATTRVPDRARGFVLNGPNSAIVDLGTEFQMGVDQSGVTDVAVTNGEIELSLLGDDGNTLVSQRVTENGSVRLDRSSESLKLRSDEIARSFPVISAPAETPLVVPAEYADDVRRLEPVLYWRFEDGAVDVPGNESDGAHVGEVRHGESQSSLMLVDGHVKFEREKGLRFIQTKEAIDQLGTGPVSFEFWMRPDDLQHATCLGVFPDDERPGVTHLNVVEIVTNTFLVHEPGAVRFLVRSPPGQGPKDAQEFNAFTPSLCTPGRWQHVVAVWDQSEVRLYSNGHLHRQISVQTPQSPGRFHVIIGQLKPHRNERQFSGALDEVAVYRRALSDDDVKRHFDIISKQNHGRLVSETSR